MGVFGFVKFFGFFRFFEFFGFFGFFGFLGFFEFFDPAYYLSEIVFSISNTYLLGFQPTAFSIEVTMVTIFQALGYYLVNNVPEIHAIDQQ